MKQRLLILSDLWGLRKAAWMDDYARCLSPFFEVTYYDSCELGGIDLSDYCEKSIHQQFVNGGIEKAVETLCAREQEPVNILAFSIGGTIAWKAAYASLQVENYYAVSATRLRYETQKPTAKLKLYFGEADNYQPAPEWVEAMKVDFQIFKNQPHQLYSDPIYIEKICRDIILF